MTEAELIEKMADALSGAQQFFNARDEMNAAVHYPDQLRESPITTMVNEAMEAWRQWRFNGPGAGIEVQRLIDTLHRLRAHPDYEYATTTCARKQGPANEPEGEGWEPNGEGHESWERFDYHEEYYWRRCKEFDKGTRDGD